MFSSHTDRLGNVIKYTYDGVNRPTQVQYNIPAKGGKLTVQSTVSYSWDAGNRVTQAADSIAGNITRAQLAPLRGPGYGLIVQVPPLQAFTP